MLRLSVVLSALVLTPVADTVWWNTTGGNVKQHRDQDGASCTLVVENESGQFTFVWDLNLPAYATVTHEDWAFPPGQITAVAVKIGDVWLERGNGAPNLMAMTGASSLRFVLNQPVDELLRTGREVAIRTTDMGFAVTLPGTTMRALVTALRKCRAAIGR
jgi:hypothetical protein